MESVEIGNQNAHQFFMSLPIINHTSTNIFFVGVVRMLKFILIMCSVHINMIHIFDTPLENKILFSHLSLERKTKSLKLKRKTKSLKIDATFIIYIFFLFYLYFFINILFLKY